MNISGPEISCACILYPESCVCVCVPHLLAHLLPRASARHQVRGGAGSPDAPGPSPQAQAGGGHPPPWLQPGMGRGRAVPKEQVGNAGAGCTSPGQSRSSPTLPSSMPAGGPQDPPGTPAPIPSPRFGIKGLRFPWHHRLQGQGRSTGTTWGRSQRGPGPVGPSLAPPLCHPLPPLPALPVPAATDANCGGICVRWEQDIDAACHPSIGLTSLRHR